MQGPVRTILISVIYLASALVAFPQAASRRGQTVTGFAA